MYMMTILTAKSVWYVDQAEFRKLQEQVRDVSMNLKNRFRASAYEVRNSSLIVKPLKVKTFINEKLI